MKNVDGATPAVLAALSSGFSLANFTIRNVDVVGPTVGGQLRRQAIFATLYALGGMLVYIAIRFEWGGWCRGGDSCLPRRADSHLVFFFLFHYEILRWTVIG